MDLIEQALQSMAANLQKNTGKSVAEWVEMVQEQDLEKHGQIIQFLKETHGLTHGYANFVAHKSKGSDANSIEDETLLQVQYKGKEHFWPLYEKIIQAVSSFGKDLEIAPKKSYVSLRRKKQFAQVQAASKTRFEIGLILKGQDPQGKLKAILAENAMFTHKIDLSHEDEFDQEVLEWLHAAYELAG